MRQELTMNLTARQPTPQPARYILAAALAIALVGLVGAQESMAELNERYSFPLSVGVGYRDLQPAGGFASGFSYREIGAELRVPFPAASTLQPFLRAGSLSVLESGSAGGAQFDHGQAWAALGLGYSTRFSRNFELGVEAAGGLYQSAFSNLSPGNTVGELGYLAEAGARIGLIPSYNLAVDLRPSLRYSRTAGLLDDFDGFYFGLGLALSWRFGQDPDAAAAAVRALRLEEAGRLPPAFAAMQSYYAANPFARVALVNAEGADIRDVELSFFQPGYMDAPTPSASIALIPPRGRVEVDILAAFNQEVFRTEGAVPLAGELIARYRYRGRPVEQRIPVSYELLDRTAISWDDDRKVGAFITPADSAMRNYASFVTSSLRGESLPQLNQALQGVAQLYAALASFGLLYQADPSTPFVRAQAGTIAIDSVSLARATLTRGTGDCDDLTVLFASILESMGHETGFITVPGHIYLAVNTKIPARDYREIHTDRSMTIVHRDQLWIPIEITLVGKQPFADAWRRGAELWRLYDADASKRAFYATAEAQALYKPVGLRETDLGLQYGTRAELLAAYRPELARLGDFSLAELAAQTARSGDKRDWNALGIAYAKYGRIKDAEASFTRALRIDPAFVGAQVNLGNLAYMQKDYRKALSSWQVAVKALDAQGKARSASAQMIQVNISMAYNALADFSSARTSFERAAAIDPERVRDFAYLASVGAGSGAGSRAAELSDAVIFVRDE
ncbi:MAG TPA: hypothetical protein DCG47_02245 [Spirochaetaceae bacterium]|nr:hypothetical protein [Spirochaetaceae bacterium]